MRHGDGQTVMYIFLDLSTTATFVRIYTVLAGVASFMTRRFLRTISSFAARIAFISQLAATYLWKDRVKQP